jgi:TetR/AcrR family transcriptional regulator, tetracycline repressor protein
VAVTRDEIVRVALRLLDDGGLAAVTLRKVAGELGVQAPALYWHVRNKRELLDLMAEELVSAVTMPAEPAPGQAWWDWLTERTRAAFEGLRAHRDSALVTAGNRPTWRSLPLIEQQLAALVSVGFPAGEALQAMLSLGAFVLGSALEEQSEFSRPYEQDAERREALAEQMRSEDTRLPTLAAAMSAMKDQGGPEGFEYGLRLIVWGLRLRQVELRGGADVDARQLLERVLGEALDAAAAELTRSGGRLEWSAAPAGRTRSAAPAAAAEPAARAGRGDPARTGERAPRRRRSGRPGPDRAP